MIINKINFIYMCLIIGYLASEKVIAYQNMMYAYPNLNVQSKLWNGLYDDHVAFAAARIHFFYGPTLEDNVSYPIMHGRKIILHHDFDKMKNTILYLHGYDEYIETEHVMTIVKAYYSRGDSNILVLDWSELSSGNYVTEAVPNALQLSHLLADLLIYYFMDDVEILKFHIIGFSLGAQLAGMTGRSFHTKTRLKLNRITALDPAFPLFYPPVYTHLSYSDAKFVDVIHSDAWMHGAPISTGTVDFWPNSGRNQPGCPSRSYYKLTENDLCSHRRAWQYWAESVKTGNTIFYAIKCFSWFKFKYHLCMSTSSKTMMGIDCPHNVTGDYFLQTNSLSPFSRGKSGIMVT